MKRLFLMVFLVLSAVGCRPNDSAAGASTGAAGSDLRVRVEVEGEPQVGPAPVTVYVLQNGEGVQGAAVEVVGDMTHAGMTPVVVEATESEPGLYRAEDFAFTMAGDWVLSADITLGSGQQLSSETRVTVLGE